MFARSQYAAKTPKTKLAPIPLYAYITDSPEASPLDFCEVYLQDGDNTESNNRPVIFETGSVVLIQATDFLSDIVLGRFIKDVYAGESEATVQIYHNDIDNPLVLLSSTQKNIQLSDVLQEVTTESFDVLSEAEYIKITDHDNQQPIPTANESSEPTDDDISLAPFLLETRSRRKRSVPLRLAEDYIIE